MTRLVACFLLLGSLAFNINAQSERPTVEISTGRLQGVIEYNMQAFKNIPYAAAPVGDLRWRPPQAAIAWSGIRDASQFDPKTGIQSWIKIIYKIKQSLKKCLLAGLPLQKQVIPM